MKGMILAGGTGSRMAPLTTAVNKHLLPIGDRPMLQHGVEKLRDAGITRILITTGPEAIGDLARLLGGGSDLGVEITWRVQDRPGGISQAIALAEDFAAGDALCVLLGDNIFENALDGHVAAWPRAGARVLLRPVPDPERFGVAEVDGDRIVRIVEKPAEPASNLAVTGLYIYDATVFDRIRTLKPSARGELEVSDLNQTYVDDGTLTFGVVDGWWTDAGTHESYARANALVRGDA